MRADFEPNRNMQANLVQKNFAPPAGSALTRTSLRPALPLRNWIDNFQLRPGRKISRRDALRHLSAGALLAAGLWPGALRAADRGYNAKFRFVVVNDTHLITPECGP